MTAFLPKRAVGLDILRGLAVLLMLVDHLFVLGDPGSPVRLVTRLSMPLFFVIAGHLASCNWRRLLWVGAWGLVLPVWVPWIDSPNVLFIYAVCCPLVVWLYRRPQRALGVVAVTLTLAANGWLRPVGYYDPLCVLSLMIVGRALPLRDLLASVQRPQLVAVVGRHALAFYVVHLLVLRLWERIA